MPPTRRSLLLGSGVAIGTIAGCQSLGIGQSSKIGLTLRNYTDTEQPLRLELLREDKTEAAAATVLDTEYNVPAPRGDNGSAGTIRETDVVPSRRYLVQVLLKNGRYDRFHAHYYPNSSTGRGIDISIYRDETTRNLFVDFGALP